MKIGFALSKYISIFIEQHSGKMTAMNRYTHPAMRDVTLRNILGALADPCRMAIVAELLREDRRLACNEVPLEVSKATRSHHFEVLRDAGLIRTCVEGTKCMTSLRKDELEPRFPGLLALLATEAGVGAPKRAAAPRKAVKPAKAAKSAQAARPAKAKKPAKG